MLSNRNGRDVDRWNRYQALKTRRDNMGENGLTDQERQELIGLASEFERKPDPPNIQKRKSGFRKAVELLGYTGE